MKQHEHSAPPPARLTASATLALPRLGLYALCVVYILAGLIGRDPWKSEDAATFGVMWTMAYGTLADWLLPNVTGAPVIDNGPLMYWAGAIAIQLFGTVFEAGHAARMATIAFFLLASGSLWYATYLLGRRPAAQPLALAFGGQPDPRDYGRALADGALLIMLGTLGLLTRIHESSTDVAMLAMLCLALYAMVRSLDRPIAGAFWMALALIGLGLTRGPVLVVTVTVSWLALLLMQSDLRAARRRFFLITLPLIFVGLLAWPLLSLWLLPEATAHFEARAAWRAVMTSGTDAHALARYARDLPWFTWLAWPLAVWSLWSWRRQAATAHIAIPVTLIGSVLLLLLTTPETSDGMMLMLLPGLIVLGAFGLPTLKRGAANGIDWFSLMIYSGAGLLIWLGWIALMTGVPPKIAANFARKTVGFTPEFNLIEFVVAVLASIAWLGLVHWRLSRQPKVLWRSVVLSSAGLTLSWVLLMTLWLPSINYGKTYRGVALEMARAIDTRTNCIETENLGLAQRASFAYFAGLRFTPLGHDGSQASCPYLLRQDNRRQPLADLPTVEQGGDWRLIWQGQRPSDRDERFHLYLRNTGR